ncbi:MAG TPA: TIGR04211 family SH3 domain-containing protein [Methylococcaceae bacterium]|nr:TIGR04211 family SH3 domain-containing protein [Methylococcaceae bacterium]
MRTLLFMLGLVLAFGAHGAAQQAFVSDQLEAALRSADHGKGKTIKAVPSGTAVKVLHVNEESGYSYVAVEGGMEGWIASQQLMPAPPARLQMDNAIRKAEELAEENKALKSELETLKTQYRDASESKADLTVESQRLGNELTMIREASANTIQLMEERNQFQEKSIALEHELENLRREKEALAEDDSQSWFLIGAGVITGGVLLGLLLPRLAVKRRRWDSF